MLPQKFMHTIVPKLDISEEFLSYNSNTSLIERHNLLQELNLLLLVCVYIEDIVNSRKKIHEA